MRQIDKVVKVTQIQAVQSDVTYWQSQPYAKRIEALEHMRTAYNHWKYGAEQSFQCVYRVIKPVYCQIMPFSKFPLSS